MPVKIDIIILSYAKNDALKALTIETVRTLMYSEDPEQIRFDVLVIESNRALEPYQFENSKTIYPDTKFGFNKFLNIGITATGNNYVCLCNNDLIFHKGWATSLLAYARTFKTNEVVLSPFCDKSHHHFAHLSKPVEGYFGYFAGHCFFTTRATLAIIGPFDERINFWYSDMDFLETIKKFGIRHYLVPESKVYHVGSMATKDLTRLQLLGYTEYPRIYYRYKWDDKRTVLYFGRLTKYFIKYCYYLLFLKGWKKTK